VEKESGLWIFGGSFGDGECDVVGFEVGQFIIIIITCTHKLPSGTLG